MKEFILRHPRSVFCVLLPLAILLLYYGLLYMVNISLNSSMGSEQFSKNRDFIVGAMVLLEVGSLWYLKNIGISFKISHFILHFFMYFVLNFVILISPWVFLIIAFNL